MPSPETCRKRWPPSAEIGLFNASSGCEGLISPELIMPVDNCGTVAADGGILCRCPQPPLSHRPWRDGCSAAETPSLAAG